MESFFAYDVAALVFVSSFVGLRAMVDDTKIQSGIDKFF